MNLKYIFLFSILLLLVDQVKAQRDVFLDKTEAAIILIGDARSYEYRVDDVDSHYDKENMNIKINFPLFEMQANNPNHLDLIQPLLKPALYPVMSLVILISEETKNLKTYRDPVKLRRPGRLEFRGNRYEVPVQISLFSDGSSLFYNLFFELNLEEMNLLISEKEMLGLTGIVQFYVTDGEWAEYFVDL